MGIFVPERPGQAVRDGHRIATLPKAGDALFSNRRRPLLTMTENTSPGIHDTLLTCCDRFLYEQLGCTEYHRNCADNLDIAIAPPVSRPGDHVTLLAERPCIVALSACPMDLMPIDGPDQTPRDVALEVSAEVGPPASAE